MHKINPSITRTIINERYIIWVTRYGRDRPQISECIKSKHSDEAWLLVVKDVAVCFAKWQLSQLLEGENVTFPSAPVLARVRNLASEGWPRRWCHSSDVADMLIAGNCDRGRCRYSSMYSPCSLRPAPIFRRYDPAQHKNKVQMRHSNWDLLFAQQRLGGWIA